MDCNIKKSSTYTSKFNITLYMVLILLLFSNRITLAQGNNIIKGGMRKYPISEDMKVELVLCVDGVMNPEFDIKLIEENGTKIPLTEGYKGFPKINGAYNIAFDRNYNEADKGIEICLREKNSKKIIDKKILNISVSENDVVHNEYESFPARNNYREYVYYDGIKITDDEKLDQSLLDYIDDDNIYKDDEVRFSSIDGEMYKLHIYDLKRDKWIIDEGQYKKEVSWVAYETGEYILDLWVKSKESTRDYDRWLLKPVEIKSRGNIDIDYFFTGSDPMVEGDVFNFYIKANTDKMVQYKAWIIEDKDDYKSGEKMKKVKVTDGYTEYTPGNEFYEFKYDGDLAPGKYRFWIWARGMGEKDSWNVALGKNFTVEEGYGGIDEYFGGSLMMYPEKDIYAGDRVIITGINVLDSVFNDYVYKLEVYNSKGTKKIYSNEKFEDRVSWTPEEPGEYVIMLSGISKKNHKDIQANKINGRRLIPIIVKDPEHSNNRKEYVIVKDFQELRNAIYNHEVILIENKEVRESYEKALDIIDEIITDEMNDIDKLMALNDYIVKNVQYDTDYVNNLNINSTTIYGALIQGKAVCQGYADSMKLFLDILEIPNRLIMGSASNRGKLSNHMWNVVRINGKEYHIDTTFNDPMPDIPGQTNYLVFLASDEDIEHNHIWDRNQYGEIHNKEYKYFSDMRMPKVKDQWIYYTSVSDGMKLYRIKRDGTDVTRLSNEFVREFIIYEDQIYFTVKNGGYIYSVRNDGLGIVKLNNEPSIGLVKEGEWIKYRNSYDGKYYVISTDGKKKLPYVEKNKNQ